MELNELLAFSVENKASDLHISSGNPPIIRVDGDMRKLNVDLLTAAQCKDLIYQFMSDGCIKDLEKHKETDFSFDIPGLARFRANIFMQDRGISGVFRTIPTSILSLDEISGPPIFKDIANLPRGLVLITGPTGSGKSTTLAAMIDYINETRNQHILTIEDPIEFVHQSKKSLINQREVYRDTDSFKNALRSALREDPDVILVGEMRDLETIRLALSAAETGHLVFATLHTTSAPKAIDRIIDVFPGDEKAMVRSMLSESLQAVISQLLVRKPNGGRVPAHEIMMGVPAVRNLIREDKVAQLLSAMQTGMNSGMQTMDQALVKLVRSGVITKEEALSRCVDRTAFGMM